jgi:hypothetical protein
LENRRQVLQSFSFEERFVMNLGKRSIVAVCLLTFVLLVTYVALNTSGTFHFTERPGFMNYGMLAEAFAAGHLYLEQEVDPERLKMTDPRDPSAPYPYIFDSVIWNGKYYFQQEPLPGLIRVMLLCATGITVPTSVVVVMTALGIFLVLGMLLRLIQQQHFPESRDWMLWYIWLAFGFSGIQLYIASRPVVYHEASGEGCFLVLTGCLLLFHGLGRVRRGLLMAGLSGMCFGAAIACRALLVVYPMTFIFCFLAFALIRRERPAGTLKWAFVIAGPVCVWIGALLFYNHLRFGDWLDFGRSHVIFLKRLDYLYCTLEGKFFRWEHIPHHLHDYLLSLPWIINKFPYLRYPYGEVRLSVGADDIYLIRELVCSVFVTMPVLLLALPFPLLPRRCLNRGRLSLILVFLGMSAIAVLGLLSAFVGAAARYYYDFTPALFILAFCNLAAFSDKFESLPRTESVGRGVLVVLFLGNLFMGLLLGLTGAVQ